MTANRGRTRCGRSAPARLAAGQPFRLRYETGMLEAYPIFQTLRLPVIGAPLFIISGPDLVIAQCKAGIVGAFPALNVRPQALLDEWLHRITEELAAWNRDNPDRPAAPFAVNQIVHKSNEDRKSTRLNSSHLVISYA